MKNCLSLSISLMLCFTFFSFHAEAQRKKKKKSLPKTDTVSRVVPSPGVRDKVTFDAQKDNAMKQKKAALPWMVSFVSIGEGIDWQTEKKFLDLHQKMTQDGCELFLNKTAYGREGERDYCVSSANSDCMLTFRMAVEKLISGNRLVFINDDKPCK